jgi:hypothetical protein
MKYFFAQIHETCFGGPINGYPSPGVEHTTGVLLSAPDVVSARLLHREALHALYQHEWREGKSDGGRPVIAWTWEGGTIEGYLGALREISEADASVLSKYSTVCWDRTTTKPTASVETVLH